MAWFKGKHNGPPDAAAVLGRARILGTRIVHAMAWPPPDQLADVMSAWSQADRDGFAASFDEKAAEVRRSLESSGLWPQITPDERAFFAARLTERTQQQCVDSSWSVESLACLLWALRLLPALSAYDSEHDPDTMLRLVPPAGAAVSLRPAAELERGRSVAELWHWRSRTRQLIESGASPGLPDNVSFDDIVRKAANLAYERNDIGEPIGGDFPACGKAYRDATPDEYIHATSIASERHKALNWVCGAAPENRWDLTPTDT